jgi:ankyrin repeat protein
MLLYVARRGFLTHRLKPAPLIKMGADVHATDDDGNSALLIAAEHNMTAAAMVLMRSGAAPDQRVLAALEERVRDAEIEAKHFSGICLVKERLQEARRALRMCRERMP